MNIEEPVANMVIDIGGGTTDIAILSLNGIASSSSIKLAGNTFDQDIIKYIKDNKIYTIDGKYINRSNNYRGVCISNGKKILK